MAKKFEGKTKRVTIMLPIELDAKVRAKQAQLIAKYNESFSFSRVLADALDGKYKI